MIDLFKRINEVSVPELEPIPAYRGVDNDFDITNMSGDTGMHGQPNEVLFSYENDPGADSEGTHPFKISVNQNTSTLLHEITVGSGIVLIPTFSSDPSGNLVAFVEQQEVSSATIATGISEGDTVGVWLDYTLVGNGAATNPYATSSLGGSYDIGPVLVAGYKPSLSSPRFSQDSSYILGNQTGARAESGSNKMGHFIGQVSVAVDGSVDIDQWTEDNITLFAPTWGHGLASIQLTGSMASNSLLGGDEGGLAIQLLSTQDANNTTNMLVQDPTDTGLKFAVIGGTGITINGPTDGEIEIVNDNP